MAKETTRIITGLSIKDQIRGMSDIVIDTPLRLFNESAIEADETVIIVKDITRIKDGGIASITDVHSHNWPGYIASFIDAEDPDPNAAAVQKLYIPENNITGISFKDVPKVDDKAVAVKSDEPV
jgi:hypothetical protein